MFSANFCTIPKKQQLKTSPFRLQFCTTSRWQITPKYWYSPLVSLNFLDYEQPRVVSGILDEWAQNRFVNKRTISRLQVSFLNQGKHSLVFHFFFNWEKTPLRLISIYLWYSFNRKISGISALMFLFPAKHTRFEFSNEYMVTIDVNLRRWHLKVKKMTLYWSKQRTWKL